MIGDARMRLSNPDRSSYVPPMTHARDRRADLLTDLREGE